LYTENCSQISTSSGFPHDASEIFAVLEYNTALNGNPLTTFRDNVLVPYSRVKKSKKSRKLARETCGLCRERRGRRLLSDWGTVNGDAAMWEREEVST
jgi:hypothetical protein